MIGWWLILTHKSRQVAQEESRRQSQALFAEIESHRQTDALLQAAKTRADTANEAKTRYITNISHELRTPLNAILGYAQLLDEDARMPAHRSQAIKVIRRGGEHLLSLIEGSLDLARIEAGRFRLEPREWGLREAMVDLQRLLGAQAAAKGLDFEVVMPPGLPDTVKADGKRVQQVLINLVGNAIKFTVAGHVRLRVQHRFDMARFVIEDSGPGMSEAELARVFEPFERASVETAAGSGLGLTIAKLLTDLMGGDLTVASTLGQGSRFELRLFLPRLHTPEPPATLVLDGTAAPTIDLVMPAREPLVALQKELSLGHVKGIHQQLDQMLAADPASAAFVAELRALAREFQLPAMSRLVARALQAVD